MRLIVHGGAAAWNYYNHDEVLQAMHAAVAVGWEMLCNDGTALDAVEAATVVLEDHPIFDAGTGSHLNDRGEVEMDALITDGWQRDFGAVAGLRHIKNPIKLARVIMSHTRHRFFIANGAEALAEELGIPLVPNMSLVTDAELAIFRKMLARTETEPHPDLGTVGAVALDADGHLASATSTGGSPFKKQGRVGDVPIYGAGGYSDDRFGGASTTGVGENIMRHLLSKMAVDLMEEGLSANDAATQAVQQVAREIPSPEVGLIVIDAQGRLGAAHTTAHMAVAWIDTEGEPHASMTGPYDFT